MPCAPRRSCGVWIEPDYASSSGVDGVFHLLDEAHQDCNDGVHALSLVLLHCPPFALRLRKVVEVVAKLHDCVPQTDEWIASVLLSGDGQRVTGCQLDDGVILASAGQEGFLENVGRIADPESDAAVGVGVDSDLAAIRQHKTLGISARARCLLAFNHWAYSSAVQRRDASQAITNGSAEVPMTGGCGRRSAERLD